jgi:integrase
VWVKSLKRGPVARRGLRCRSAAVTYDSRPSRAHGLEVAALEVVRVEPLDGLARLLGYAEANVNHEVGQLRAFDKHDPLPDTRDELVGVLRELRCRCHDALVSAFPVQTASEAQRDVDLDAATIAVKRSRVAVSSADVRESTTKTGKARHVELDAETNAALVAWQERQQAERKAWPGTRPAHGLVFTLQDGTALHPDYIGRTFRPHMKRSKLPKIRLHDLRHTRATLMLAAGVPVKVVSERLGHSTPAFTMAVYQHVLPGDQRGHVRALANAKTKAARHLRVVGA